jgi:hypothetical protein
MPQPQSLEPLGDVSHFQRLTTATGLTDDDVVSFDSVKRKLRQLGMDDDLLILEEIQAAVNDTEKRTNRTFRLSVSSTAYYSHWSYVFYLPRPPAVSVSSIKYYATGATSTTTVTASDYRVLISTDNVARVEFPADHSFPTLDTDRIEPIEIAYTRGYPSAAAVPPLAKVAIRQIAAASFEGDSKMLSDAYLRLQPLIYRGLP